MTWVLVGVLDVGTLAAARLGNQRANILVDSGIPDQGWEYNAPVGVYLYIRDAEDSQEDVETVRTRMLIHGTKDPATGSAASALAAFLTLAESEKHGRGKRWKMVQGVEMGRRSEIGVRVTLKDDAVETIELSGIAVVVSEGRIWVDTVDTS